MNETATARVCEARSSTSLWTAKFETHSQGQPCGKPGSRGQWHTHRSEGCNLHANTSRSLTRRHHHVVVRSGQASTNLPTTLSQLWIDSSFMNRAATAWKGSLARPQSVLAFPVGDEPRRRGEFVSASASSDYTPPGSLGRTPRSTLRSRGHVAGNRVGGQRPSRQLSPP